jgi:acyl carrier protein
MTEAELTELVKRKLYEIAPDIEGEEIVPDEPFADQFEIDSMDLLNFVIALHKATGLEIPEADHGRLVTMAGAVAYLQERTAASSERR